MTDDEEQMALQVLLIHVLQSNQINDKLDEALANFVQSGFVSSPALGDEPGGHVTHGVGLPKVNQRTKAFAGTSFSGVRGMSGMRSS